MGKAQCELCSFYVYDEEYAEYICDISMDQDEMERIHLKKHSECPYFHIADDYSIVRKQN